MDTKEIAYLKSEEEFNRARRKALIEEIVAGISGSNLDLLSFEEVVQRLRLRNTIPRGLQDIPLDEIAGSCGRYTDFTRTFTPRRAGRGKERWRQIYTLAVTGKGFPPIEVYKIDRVYFVRDGNHRVSVARELKWNTIQAYVTELPTVFTLTPEVKPDELLIKEECAIFLEKTGLHKTRPGVDITFTTPGHYNRLLRQISVYRYYLSKKRTDIPGYDESVLDWYDHFYTPMIKRIKHSGVMALFPGRTPDDLLAWITEHQKELRISQQMDSVGYVPDVQDFLKFIDNLSPLTVAKAEIGKKLKAMLGGKQDNEKDDIETHERYV